MATWKGLIQQGLKGMLAEWLAGVDGDGTATTIVPRVTAGGKSAIVSVTFTLDTGGAYAAGDVLADTQEIAGAVRVNDGTGVLTDIVILDEDDQAAATMDVYLLDANVSMGTENAAISITDANARNILGVIPIAVADWKDLINSRMAHIRNVDTLVRGVSGGTSIYVALVTGGTPTQTANGIRGRFKFIQD